MPTTKSQNGRVQQLAQRCIEALRLASDADRLRASDDDELKIAAVLLARALDQALQVTSAAVLRADAVRQLETAGQAIGAEIRRRERPVETAVKRNRERAEVPGSCDLKSSVWDSAQFCWQTS